jgi:hypothetical protein
LRNVPEAVWNFHIGGYQVCEKWLKDRKGRTLTADDIAHYHKIVIALHETIRLMGEIDAVIEAHGGWPGAFAPRGGASNIFGDRLFNSANAVRTDVPPTLFRQSLKYKEIGEYRTTRQPTLKGLHNECLERSGRAFGCVVAKRVQPLQGWEISGNGFPG